MEFVETTALLRVMEGDASAAEDEVRKLLPGELALFRGQLRTLTALVDLALTSGSRRR